MALPAHTRKLVEGRLEKYCAQRVPLHVRHQVRLNFKFRGNSVTLFEVRPAFGAPDVWVDIKVAQFRFDPAHSVWTLYCADRNSKWHEYYEIEPSPNFDDLLEEVEDDPTGIFWG